MGSGFSLILSWLVVTKHFSIWFVWWTMAIKSDATQQNSTTHHTMAFPDHVPSLSEVSQSDGTAVELPIHTLQPVCPTDGATTDADTARRGCEQQLNRGTVPFTSAVVIWDSCRGWYDCYSAFAFADNPAAENIVGTTKQAMSYTQISRLW